MGVRTLDQWRNNLYFFPTIAYSCHLFLYKMWLFIIFFHIFFQGFIKQWIDRNSARSFCAAARSYYPVSWHALIFTTRSFYKDYQMVTLFFLFVDIWAGTNSQVQFPIVSRKSLTVDSCSWGLVIIFNDYNLSAC